MEKVFNIQQLFEQQDETISMPQQCMVALRETWLRPLNDNRMTTYTLQTKKQREIIGFMLAKMDNLLQKKKLLKSILK
jgi:hypothetical protein